ncbi:MAG: hypothetical protein U0791_24350 [Gemmataceae bacterium]
MKTTNRKPRTKTPKKVPPAPPCPGIDRTPDVTNWLAKWANLTALLQAAADAASDLACEVRPGSAYFKPTLAPLGISRARMDHIDRTVAAARGATIPVPFAGTVIEIGDGMLKEPAAKGGPGE